MEAIFSPPKAVHLTSVHPVTDTRIRAKECATLVEAGWEVVLVAPHEGPDAADGVRLHRLPRPGNRLMRFLSTSRQVYKAARAEQGDVYHFHDPELLGVGLALQWGGAQVVYDVHEDAPATMAYKYYISRPFRPVLAWLIDGLEQAAAWRFSAVVAATPAIRDRFSARARRIALVQNFPRIEGSVASRPTPYRERRPWAAYVGVVSEARGIFEMVRAMGQLPAHLGARLQLAGPVSPPSLRERASHLPGWDAVDVHGMVDRAEGGRLLDSVRVGLVLLHPERNYLVAYATKMFEYMAAGIPVVASHFPLWRQIVAEVGCGLLVDPLNPAQIAEAIAYLLEHAAEAEAMGERGRRAVQERYNWESEAAKLLELYAEVRCRGLIPAAEGGRGTAFKRSRSVLDESPSHDPL